MPNKPDEAGDKIEVHGGLDVLASISHEVRTPLHAILGLSQLIEDEPINDTVKRHLDKIRVASEALLQTLNTSIDAARLGKNELRVDQTEIDIQTACETATKMFALNAESKGVELLLSFDPALIGKKLMGDPSRLLQVLSNLIGNAVKFTDSGQITLWCVQRETSAIKTEVFFAVQDTGCGIPQEHIDTITQRYTQISKDQQGRPQGSGLGLFICAKVLDLLGSKLDIHSDSSGSRFSFTLGFDNSAAASSEPPVRFADNVHVRFVARPGVKSEVMLNLLRGLGAQVDYRTYLTRDLVEKHSGITFVDYRCILAEPVAFERMKAVIPKGQLIVLCTELSSICSDSQRFVTTWFSPYLPSQLLELADSQGLMVGANSRVKRFLGFEADESIDRASLKILAVDDSPTNMIVLQGALKKLGYTDIVTANNGQKAIEEVELNPDFDLILMDINMPIMGGIEATTRLRAYGLKIPVISLTALSESELGIESGTALFDGHLSKPASANDIDRVILKSVATKPISTLESIES